MTELATGWLHASVALVTTEREHVDSQPARAPLPDSGGPIPRPADAVSAAFPQDRLDALAARAGQPPPPA